MQTFWDDGKALFLFSLSFLEGRQGMGWAAPSGALDSLLRGLGYHLHAEMEASTCFYNFSDPGGWRVSVLSNGDHTGCC